MAQQNKTLGGLNDLIDAARRRLSANPDYIALRALEKAREEIMRSQGDLVDAIDDQTRTPVVIAHLKSDSPIRITKSHSISQAEGTAMALEKVGEPLPIAELVQRARAAGASVGGKNPELNLGSTLSRSEDFVSVRWNGRSAWWFKDRPLPDVSNLLHAAE